MGLQVIIGDVFDSDMVTLGGMFLGQLLGGGQLLDRGSHCMRGQLVRRETIQETKRQ